MSDFRCTELIQAMSDLVETNGILLTVHQNAGVQISLIQIPKFKPFGMQAPVLTKD